MIRLLRINVSHPSRFQDVMMYLSIYLNFSLSNADEAPAAHGAAFRADSADSEGGEKGAAMKASPLVGPGRLDSATSVAARPREKIPVEGGLNAEGGACGRPSSVAPCSEDAILVGGGPGAEGGACRSSCWILYLSLYIHLYFFTN